MERNPQNIKPEIIGKGFRLLEQHEADFINTDSESRGREFARFIQLEFYSFASCQWQKFDPDKGSISASLSYRTREPLNILSSFAKIQERDNFADCCFAFVASFEYLAEVHHSRMLEKGFWDGEEKLLTLLGNLGGESEKLIPQLLAAFDGQKLALQTSEVSEALEGLRHGNPPDDKIPEFLASEAELADVILRLMDHAKRRGWRVAEALVEKMSMNATREKMHGKGF